MRLFKDFLKTISEVIKDVKKDKRKGFAKKDVIIECLLNNEQDVSVNKCWFNYILAGSFCLKSTMERPEQCVKSVES